MIISALTTTPSYCSSRGTFSGFSECTSLPSQAVFLSRNVFVNFLEQKKLSKKCSFPLYSSYICRQLEHFYILSFFFLCKYGNFSKKLFLPVTVTMPWMLSLLASQERLTHFTSTLEC
jgi:hypothetical protein